MSLRERLTLDNPVLTKELRVRMRGSRAYWLMLAYLGFLALVMLGMYAGWLQQNHSYGSSSVAQLGTTIYTGIYITQIFLVLFITPAITSGALTIEREQQTSDMLTMSRMSSGTIVAGKLFSAVAFTALLLLTSLPLVSLCFTMGSIDPMMVFQSYMMMLAGSLFVGAMGLMWSSIAKTTAQAVMYTYLSMVVAGFSVYIGYGYAQWGGSANDSVTINIFHAIGASWFGEAVSDGLSLSSFGFVIMCFLLSLIMITVAASRLDMWPERKGGILRGLTTLAVGLQLVGVNRWWFHAITQGALGEKQYMLFAPIEALCLPAVLMMLLVTIFCTGEFASHDLRRLGKTLRDGWKWEQLKRGVLASGVPFMVLLTLFSLVLFVGCTGLFGHFASMQSYGFTPTTPALTASFNSTVAQSRAIFQVPASGLLEAALVMVSAVFGFGTFCQFISALVKNRWAAWLAASMTLCLVWLLPFVAVVSALSTSSDGKRIPHVNSLVHLVYLNPAYVIKEVLQDRRADTFGLLSTFGITPDNLVLLSVAAWLAIAALSVFGIRFIAGFSARRATITSEKAAA